MVEHDLRATPVTRFDYITPDRETKVVTNAEELKNYSLEVLNSRIGRKDTKAQDLEVQAAKLLYQLNW